VLNIGWPSLLEPAHWRHSLEQLQLAGSAAAQLRERQFLSVVQHLWERAQGGSVGQREEVRRGRAGRFTAEGEVNGSGTGRGILLLENARLWHLLAPETATTRKGTRLSTLTQLSLPSLLHTTLHHQHSHPHAHCDVALHTRLASHYTTLSTH